jgi:polysaccharide export outer membrane protein
MHYGGGMFNRKNVLTMVLLITFNVVPVWAHGGTAPAISEKAVSLQSNETSKKGAETTSEHSWWLDLLGLGDSDPGVIAQSVSSTTASPASDYIIGPGDVLGIAVWRDENLTKTVAVLNDGRITFPLIGDMIAEGKTVAQFKLEIEKALSKYTGDSNVTVEVKQSNMNIFVTGRVKAPGKQMLVSNTNVLQALSMAGGLDPFARKHKIRIFRHLSDKTAMYSFNYDEVMEGRHLEMNIDLKRGDVIIVP